MISSLFIVFLQFYVFTFFLSTSQNIFLHIVILPIEPLLSSTDCDCVLFFDDPFSSAFFSELLTTKMILQQRYWYTALMFCLRITFYIISFLSPHGIRLSVRTDYVVDIEFHPKNSLLFFSYLRLTLHHSNRNKNSY